MRYFRLVLIFLVLLPFFYSCNKDLKVNADWKEITVVYGLLNQSDDTTFLKITKAFLGPGDALQFAKIPDSSTFPDKLDVQLQEWSGTTLNKTYAFDTITIRSKAKGDSIFYYPDQLVYFNRTKGQLNENYSYKLVITHKKTGAIDSARTTLVHAFEVKDPTPYSRIVNYKAGNKFEVKWETAYGGKRYQLLIRFHYLEIYDTGHNASRYKSADWLLFNDYQVDDPNLAQEITRNFEGELFYSFVRSNIKPLSASPHVTGRTARSVDYIFSVASDDLNTYMDVTEPSQSIIQERPSFSNIYNGIGLFASRYINEIDTLSLATSTLLELKTDTNTMNLGF